MTTFTCGDCSKPFTLPPATLAKFPGWTPKQCMDCRPASSRTSKSASKASKAYATDEVDTGVFTDGACEGNPGPGGWGAVRVRDGEIVAERSGHDLATTNNRMELRALIEGFRLIEPDEALDVYSDSAYCVNIVNKWGASWEANSWRRGKQREPILNLELIQELCEIARSRPKVTVNWVKGHNGNRWNEHADMLSRAYQFENQELRT